MVQRYDYGMKCTMLGFGDGIVEYGIIENSKGVYVKYEDYLALAAQVGMLKASAQQLSFEIAHGPSEPEFKSFGRLQDVMAATPVACLAQVRADAVEKFAARPFTGNDYLHFNLSEYAKQYVERIRQEVE
jgi:hypothetical protein